MQIRNKKLTRNQLNGYCFRCQMTVIIWDRDSTIKYTNLPEWHSTSILNWF